MGSRWTIIGRCRLLAGIAVFLGGLLAAGTASANITVAEYIQLRAKAMAGSKAAEARWRYYVIGLMDGMQAVQAPAEAAGVRLTFCMPQTLPVSPKFLDAFIQKAIDRHATDGTLKKLVREPMAVLVAIELKRAYPCK